MPDTNIYCRTEDEGTVDVDREELTAAEPSQTSQVADEQLMYADAASQPTVRTRQTNKPQSCTKLSAAGDLAGQRLAFKSQPVLLKTFLDKGTPNSAVVGLALLANLLYVVYKKPLYVFVFDTNDQRRPLPPIKLQQPSGRRAITKLLSGGGASRPTDITACPVNCRLYVGIADVQEDVIVAIQLPVKSGATDRYRCWSADGQPCGLSLTRNNNVLVCYSKERRLSEYNPDGKLIHRINLPSAIDHPWRAVALDERVWVVSHGASRASSTSHRVCLIDGQHKQMTSSHGGAPGADIHHLNKPRSLIVDAEGRFWVADCCNNRVKVLANHLDNPVELLNADDKLNGPTCLCLSDNDGVLYVGQRSGKILVFRVLQAGL